MLKINIKDIRATSINVDLVPPLLLLNKYWSKQLLNMASFSLLMQSSEGVLKNFAKFTAKFTGKKLRGNLCFNKISGLRFATLSKKRSDTGVFQRISQKY